jgi:hypothetical protein
MQNQPAQDLRKSADVLPFRRRPPPKPLAIASVHGVTVSGQQGYRAHDDLARYEQDRDEPINERQRMLMNLIAVGIVVTLITVGVWIADTIQIAVKQEDCLLQGRTNCAPIEMSAER